MRSYPRIRADSRGFLCGMVMSAFLKSAKICVNLRIPSYLVFMRRISSSGLAENGGLWECPGMVSTLNEQLDEVVHLRHAEAGAVLGEALREGMKHLYLDAVLAAFLRGDLSRTDAVSRIGEASMARAEAEVLVVREDVAWGLHGAE